MPESLEEYSVIRPPGTTGKKPRTLSERLEDFWGYVNKNPNHPKGCWEWTAGVLKCGGYPQFKINGKMWRGHRLAWILKNGPIPDGMEICHKCDNPLCVNWDHLFCGTHGANMHDMISKGRAVHHGGENAGASIFTNDQISEIRGLFTTGSASKATLARMYGSDRGNIGRIVTNRTYVGVRPMAANDPKIVALISEISTGKYRPLPKDQFGEKHSQAKLTSDAVRYIRKNYKRGEAKVLAEKYGVSVFCIRDVAYNRRWKHII